MTKPKQPQQNRHFTKTCRTDGIQQLSLLISALSQASNRDRAQALFPIYLRQAWKKKVEVGPFSFFTLNINTTVPSIMRDRGTERDSQSRSESRTDGSAASCSPAEKTPLNNNILINAPLPRSEATGSHSWRDYWEEERGETEQGPPLVPPGLGWATFYCPLPLCWEGDSGTFRNTATTEAQLILSYYKASKGWRALDKKLPSKE